MTTKQKKVRLVILEDKVFRQQFWATAQLRNFDRKPEPSFDFAVLCKGVLYVSDAAIVDWTDNQTKMRF